MNLEATLPIFKVATAEEQKTIPECFAYRYVCRASPGYKPMPEIIWKKGPDKPEGEYK